MQTLGREVPHVRSQHHSFFSLIAGNSAKENYLSRLFQACFANSLSFRRVALSTIWEVCDLPGRPNFDDWECDYQPSTRIPGGGVVDLCLRPGSDAGFRKPIFLESKVGSILTKAQLQKYKDHGAEVLVAVTKNRPEVHPQELRKLKVNSLRWQDLCRALRQSSIPAHADRFLCMGFAEYLEESGMAYREDLTKTHLDEIRILFDKIASSGYAEGKPGFSFNYAHNCLELLRDVRASALEQLAMLEEWSSWGPGYFHEVSATDGALSCFGVLVYPDQMAKY
jgi:hypothetical protein